jgi:hypothetical protein
MSVAAKVLDRLVAIGARVKAVDDRLILRAGPCAVPATLVSELVSLKPELLHLLATTAPAPIDGQGASASAQKSGPTIAAWDAGDWRDLYRKRIAIRQYNHGYPRAEAERIAWAEIETHWHMQHGRRVAAGQCAGCRKPIGDTPALNLADGTGVHLDDLDCIISYGKDWRGVATRALESLGLRPPACRS